VLQQRLLDIAIREFGSKGLEGASTRSIAAAAGTAMSSITYHYGGKEGLYLATADYIAERMGQLMGPALEAVDQPPPDTADAARAMIHRVIGLFVEKMAGEENASWSLFIVREQMNPTEAFERIYAGPLGRMMNLLVQLVCVATGVEDCRTARIVTITLLGQVIVIRASRASTFKLLQIDAVDADLIAAFKARVAANTDAILDRLTAERQEVR
jgi:AcrR family transcriptional regulator